MSISIKSENRRQFLKGWLRTIFIGGIVFAGGLLGMRKTRASGDETDCGFELPCGNCGKRKGCTDPKALESKQNNL
ncbi:hypothetical protein ACFL6K_03390 [Candidatus Latescibacterota bacterium]